MDNIAEQLKKVKVIDESDIIAFKNYIYKKYPQNTAAKNAKILSDTIHRAIHVKLEGLPEDSKISIKRATLKNTFGRNKNLITLYDIFDCCVIEENLPDNFMEYLVKWVNLHTKTEVEINKSDFYLQSKAPKTKEVIIQSEENVCIESEKISVDSVQNSEHLNSTSYKYVVLGFLANLSKLKFQRKIVLVSVFLIIVTLHVMRNVLHLKINKAEYKAEAYILESNKTVQIMTNYSNSHLPEYMRYKRVNDDKLKRFLDKHNSILSKEPYFSTIFSVAKEFNLNPIVLFSITGQEQSFVPKDSYNASKIANNPFNVYHSWKEYNTNIRDSSKITARTIINLSKDMPKNSDPFLWIGKKYAENSRWGDGVEAIFKELSEYAN